MKVPDGLVNRIGLALALVLMGVFTVDTIGRLFFRRPDARVAESTVTLAIGKARPWSAEEKRVLARVLPACRQPAVSGQLPEMVDCWLREARMPSPVSPGGQSDEAILMALLDRASYKR